MKERLLGIVAFLLGLLIGLDVPGGGDRCRQTSGAS
jgi:hypothetical protein